MIIFVSRLPFIFNGFGVEEDSWGLVLNAWEMREHGGYIHSRLPGHPVQEAVYYLIYKAPAYVYNGLSSLFSVIAAIYFYLLLRLTGFRHSFLASLAFAFNPVIYVNSVSTIDYVWALAFILASVYYFLKQKFFLSGVLLGLAFGCRITSALAVIPLLYYYWDGNRKLIDRNIVRFAGWFAAICTITYIIPLKEYGIGIFSTYSQLYPPITKVIYKGSIGIIGLLGVLIFLFYFIHLFFTRVINQKANFNKGFLNISWVKVAWIFVGLHMALYIIMPYKSAFLIPAVPFFIVLCGYYARNTMFLKILYVGLIISPFVFGIDLTDPYRGAENSRYAGKTTISGQEIFFDPLTGPVFSDYSKRKVKARFIENVIVKLKEFESPVLVLSGWWYNQLMVELKQQQIELDLVVLDHASEELLNNYYRDGFRIFGLPEITKFNDLRYKGDFTGKYVEELFPAKQE